MSTLLELTHKRLGWPAKREIMRPKGAGPGVIAGLARRKLETAIRREGVEVNVGVLATNPRSTRTEDPLAIVCDFTSQVSEKVLRETLRLAWSFSRSAMLVTVEPSVVKVWTCWRRPLEDDEDLSKLCVEQVKEDLFREWSLSVQAARTLQWVELVSGGFFRNPRYSGYFHREQRADQLMLEDLRELRRRLLDAELPEDICHDLIARVIFIEFLFQRKDSQGNAALNERVLENLHERGVLSKVHKDLPSILESKEETYKFFRELNDRFNGDLFPGKGETTKDREQEWKEEMRQVRANRHLKLLAKFVSGKMEIATNQLCLWRRYAFDAIPLEFISSIYEEFAKKKGSGVHYTPGHIVDLMLDEVLPWCGTEWDLKILDPACGSGIFLVKAYQRLVHRWKTAHGKPKVDDLRGLLSNNLFGVDKNHDAVRVASFSLYLAMCDEIEPKHVWQKNVWFPRLRDKRLIESDFFEENKDGFQTSQNRETYDLALGNAPWGHASETPESKRWARMWSWSIPNRDFGPLFLPKCAALTKANGKIAMLQPAGAMLFNRHSTAKKFREKFFSKFSVEKVINLSALRFGLFKSAVSPACIVVMRPKGPSEDPTVYECPKPKNTKQDDYCVVVEAFDRNYVYPQEEVNDRLVWTVLAWGGRRDLALIRKLRQRPFSTIADLESKRLLRIGNGFKRGILRAKRYQEAQNLPVLESHKIWDKLQMVVDSKQFPLNTDLMFERFRELEENYTLPLLIIKESWTVEAKRFKGVLVKAAGSRANKLLFSQSFSGIRSLCASGYNINNVALAINSILAVYYFLLTGARIGSYRPTLLLDDIREFPLPNASQVRTKELANMKEASIDEWVKDAYRLKDSEWVLVEDLFRYTLRDFKEGGDSPGWQPTRPVSFKNQSQIECVLRDYCSYLVRVLRAGFGEEKKISASIFTEKGDAFLPVRMVGIHLETPGEPFVRVEAIDSPELIGRLENLNRKYLESPDGAERGGIFYQRVARIYDTAPVGRRRVPTVFIVKPDQVRYWTRSMGMRDADDVAEDIMLWQNGSQGK